MPRATLSERGNAYPISPRASTLNILFPPPKSLSLPSKPTFTFHPQPKPSFTFSPKRERKKSVSPPIFSFSKNTLLSLANAETT